ncbi:MFS general substrate transporter [Aspergillus affinis]|uniref:MFS general substrate transporter n=1 Tax=Aspergillus affinis TaxID=1070780 RepID=UPI0022FE28A6|nr:MFS general substrate transporter [Aspergillus affinis]KAI9043015.1 MFS general substrate transporter [Aspergillus affinis]
MEKDELNVNSSTKADMSNPGTSTAVSSDVETIPAPSTPAEPIPEGPLNRQKTPEPGQTTIVEDEVNEEITEGTVGHYMVVIGGFCGMFASFGWRAGSGFFQGYYQQDQLRDYSPSTIAWINSVGFFLMYFGACIVGPITQRIGPQPLLLIGSAMHIAGLLGASWCTKFYQFFLTQGVISSLGASALFFISVQTMGRWFERQQALAIGIAASGVSAGGIVFPLMIQHLIPIIGFSWTMRCAVLVLLVLTTISNLTLRSPPEALRARRRMRMAMPQDGSCRAGLWDRRLWLTIAGTTLFANGYFVVLTFLTTVAHLRGWKNDVDSLVVLNGASFFGRIIPGMIAGRVGSFNTMCVLGMLSTVLVLGLWLPDSGFGGAVVFSVTFGFTSASTVSLGPAMLFQMSDLRSITRNLAVLYLVQSFAGLTSSPIGGALLDVGHKGALYLQLFCGLMTGVGTLITLLARHWLTKGALWAKI